MDGSWPPHHLLTHEGRRRRRRRGGSSWPPPHPEEARSADVFKKGVKTLLKKARSDDLRGGHVVPLFRSLFLSVIAQPAGREGAIERKESKGSPCMDTATSSSRLWEQRKSRAECVSPCGGSDRLKVKVLRRRRKRWWKVEEAGEVVEELVEEEQTAHLAPVQLCLSGLRSRQTKTGSGGVYKIKPGNNNRPHSLTDARRNCVSALVGSCSRHAASSPFKSKLSFLK